MFLHIVILFCMNNAKYKTVVGAVMEEEVVGMDEGEEGVVKEDYSDYLKSGDILYKTEWRPRDCIGPVQDGDSVSMNMEYFGKNQGGDTVEMETAVTVRIGRGQTIQLAGDGLLGMCLGERRKLVIPKSTIRNEYKKVLPDLAYGVTTYLKIELVKLNSTRWEKLDSGLVLALLEEIPDSKCGRTVIDGDTLAVEYEGSLENGTVFDSSLGRGAPFGPFVMGKRQIIAGYEIALAGRCLGERFKMIVPPHLAYGETGVGGVIPADATLHFDVRLVQLNQAVWNPEQEQKDVFSWKKEEGPLICQELATEEDQLYIHYFAVREDGSSFGSLVDKTEPYGPFRLVDENGLTNVPALHSAVNSMCLGERRKVTVPPRLSWSGTHDTIEVWVDLIRINDNQAENTLSPLVPEGPPRRSEL